MSLHWKMHTHFPFTRVFVLGIILFFLGLASMIISIIAFVTESWGHYVATGMWGGASILASGSTAIFASRLKSLASVKTLLICAVITTFTSLTMLILSAGGLSLNSGFYSPIDSSEYNKRTSNLVHASLLVISVFCLSGNILAVIVCCKYLFFEDYDKSKHRRRHRHLPEGTIRISSSLRGGATNTASIRSSSVRSNQLLVNDSQLRRHSDNAAVNRVQIEYRRSHRRSASDQQYPQQLNSHSHSRRHRHSHSHHECPQSFNGSSSNPQSSSRHRQGRHASGRALHHERLSKTEADAHRHTFQGRHTSTRNCSNEATLQIRMVPSHRSSHSHQVRLPTEFDEEELPPYEATESQPQNGLRCSDCDSGDESDSENSSSSDTHSYDAVELCAEGVESVPMVNLRHQRLYRNRRAEQATQFSSPPVVETSEMDDSRPRSNVRRSRTFDSYDRQSKSTSQQKPAHSTSDQTLSQVNPQLDQLGEYECLISVSPEVCAITGESSVVAPENDKIPHLVHENFYENGPCYENVQAVGKGNGESHLNPLSKSYTSKMDQRANSSANDEHKVTGSTIAARIVPVRMVNPSSKMSNDSPISLRSSFGSPNSAFRPVKPPSQPMSPHNFHHSSDISPCPEPRKYFSSTCLPPNMCISPLDNTPTPAPLSDPNAQLAATNEVSVNKFINQGAIPKAAKKQSQGPHKDESVSLSWKNIPLPLSYNHSESLSNDEDKKLPSKRIPFAESNENHKRKHANSSSQKQRSPCPLSRQIHKSKSAMCSSASSQLSSLSTSSFSKHPSSDPSSVPAQMVSSAPALSFSTENALPVRSKERTLITTQPLSPPTQTSSSLSSLALASLQESSFLHSCAPQQRIGGNQSFLLSRRDEMKNLQLNQQPGRWQRPYSLFEERQLNADHHGSLSPTSPTDRETSWSTADRAHPLSLSSYLMGNSSYQSHQRRQHLNSHQHHVPQPQQPRLGVQLQRRPQHHMPINNSEQPQVHNQHQHPQHQPLPQPQPQPQPQLHLQPQQEPQAGAEGQNEQSPRRINKPLFSLLL